MLTVIDPDHILFLLAKVPLSEKDRLRYIEFARSLEETHRNEVFNFLEQYDEGCKERLLGIWSNFQGRKAVFLWNLLIMGELDGEEELREALVNAIGRSLGERFTLRQLGSTWVDLPKKSRPKQGDTWIERLRLHQGQLTVEVRIVKPHKFTDPTGKAERHLKSSLITLILNVDAQVPLLKSFAAMSDSRAAVITFIGWLTGKVLGKTRNDHLEHVEPVTFTKEQMLALERLLQMENFSITAPDNEGRYSSITIVSRLEQNRHAPFDASDELAQRQRNGNVFKGVFNFRYPHGDGYVEYAEVGFSLRGRHQHLTFPRTLSRPAMDKIIAEVYNYATGRRTGASPARVHADVVDVGGVRRRR